MLDISKQLVKVFALLKKMGGGDYSEQQFFFHVRYRPLKGDGGTTLNIIPRSFG